MLIALVRCDSQEWLQLLNDFEDTLKEIVKVRQLIGSLKDCRPHDLIHLRLDQLFYLLVEIFVRL